VRSPSASGSPCLSTTSISSYRARSFNAFPGRKDPPLKSAICRYTDAHIPRLTCTDISRTGGIVTPATSECGAFARKVEVYMATGNGEGNGRAGCPGTAQLFHDPVPHVIAFAWCRRASVDSTKRALDAARAHHEPSGSRWALTRSTTRPDPADQRVRAMRGSVRSAAHKLRGRATLIDRELPGPFPRGRRVCRTEPLHCRKVQRVAAWRSTRHSVRDTLGPRDPAAWCSVSTRQRETTGLVMRARGVKVLASSIDGRVVDTTRYRYHVRGLGHGILGSSRHRRDRCPRHSRGWPYRLRPCGADAPAFRPLPA